MQTVSVGIPTYNRPEGLRRVLDCITNQSYTDLEIIVSDNGSDSDQTEIVVKEFQEKDKRVKFFKQGENKGARFNFNFVLQQASGEYFMWASDDDYWDKTFIGSCMSEFEKNKGKLCAVISEVRYFSKEAEFEFFMQGSAFYDKLIDNRFERLLYTFENNYDNLFYSIFKRSCLFKGSQTWIEVSPAKTYINENFLLLFAASQGNFRVIPEAKFFKRTNSSTYNQAKWQHSLDQSAHPDLMGSFRNINLTLHYHIRAVADIDKMVNMLEISDEEKSKLGRIVRERIWAHFLKFVPFSPHILYKQSELKLIESYIYDQQDQGTSLPQSVSNSFGQKLKRIIKAVIN